MSTQEERQLFARLSQNAMIAKGMNQAELAREAKKRAPKDVPIERYHISTYIRAITAPNAIRLKAMADALGCEPKDLIPDEQKAKKFLHPERKLERKFENLPDGNVWITINQSVSFKTGIEIMRMLNDEIADPEADG